MKDSLRNPLAEFIGTFIFVFAIIGAVNSGSALTPLAIGFALMIMVFATGHISGAHLNPAVSLGAWLRGAISLTRFVSYVVAQLAAGALAAAVSFALWPVADEPAKIEIGPAFLVEALWTFVLVYVVLNVATTKSNVHNSFYGLAIGSTVFVGAVAVGGISGGGFNPAVALGLSITGIFDIGAYWLYFLAPLVGGALAALLFRALNSDDKLPALQ
ncbi:MULTISPECIES: MIP/aquaporin family protein [Microbacterium]|uniref:Porin n=1 Tax=Microbacterium hominis TaxID=162426 RepID=A0A134DDN1_9MICO|nr:MULTISPECIES: aquaporin [Microbacterium]AUG30393.1 porin [Microbacterium hominis]KXC04645.1 porin [Microbacterium hominis]QOC26155.1 aquaporin [Microbacterium hominis]QOC30120.1 aquaporin [Microbacterium hominis]QYF97539.1 aquaporin [Microbacterium sp. PAMC21962]